ncbi:MAG: RNA-binding S4 domain-containing protein [Longicatena sp.]
MRLDKYLKTARILKRRTVSKELADQQRVYVNGKVAKPSTDVKLGDIIKVIFGYRELSVRVLMIQKQVNKNDAALMFEVVEEKLIKKEEVKDILEN